MPVSAVCHPSFSFPGHLPMPEPDLDDARRTLRDVFGFADFRPGQARVIGTPAGGPVGPGGLPDGGGQEPLLPDPRAAARRPDGGRLAPDRPDEGPGRRPGAPRGRRRPARFDASTAPEARRVYDDLRGGRLKLLYVAPERLAGGRLVETLAAPRGRPAGDRRGALHQRVGPQLPPRIPEARRRSPTGSGSAGCSP